MRVRTIVMITAVFLAAGFGAVAQVNEFDPRNLQALDQQAGELFEVLDPAVTRASEGTVELLVRRKRVGYGTVVKENKVLAKWSDVKGVLPHLVCRDGDGELRPVSVSGVYGTADLVMLNVEDLDARPVTFDDGVELKLGQFLTLARPHGEAGALGVVSVLPRSLKESDRGFLGVELDTAYDGPGVRIQFVQGGSAAARAGMKKGDIVTGLRGRAVNGSIELSSALQRLDPGEAIRIKFRRGEEQKSATVKLGSRPEEQTEPWGRMDRMNRLGGHEYSDVRDDFRHVIQSDMQIEPEDCGAPVVDLKGRVVGLAVARAGRIKSFVIPAREITALLAGKPSVAGLKARAVPAEVVPEEDPFEIMRRHMEEMQRVMREIDNSERKDRTGE